MTHGLALESLLRSKREAQATSKKQENNNQQQTGNVLGEANDNKKKTDLIMAKLGL